MNAHNFLRTTLSALFTALLLSGCAEMRGVQVGGFDLSPLADAGAKLSAASADTPEQEEVEIGRHMAGTLLGASQLSSDSSAQRYVNRVGRWLSLHSSRPLLDWRFGVLADDDVNAFAAPGGYVFVTSGLLAMLDNEAELAGVLAHEIAHVTQRHHLAAVRNNNLMGAALDVGSFLGNAATGGQASEQERAFGQKVTNASKQLYARGLDKGDEYDADSEALRLMTLAGYDPYAFAVVMQKLEARSGRDSAMALLLQTHPRPAERLRAMDGQLQDMTLPSRVATLENRYRQFIR